MWQWLKIVSQFGSQCLKFQKNCNTKFEWPVTFQSFNQQDLSVPHLEYQIITCLEVEVKGYSGFYSVCNISSKCSKFIHTVVAICINPILHGGTQCACTHRWSCVTYLRMLQIGSYFMTLFLLKFPRTPWVIFQKKSWKFWKKSKKKFFWPFWHRKKIENFFFLIFLV